MSRRGHREAALAYVRAFATGDAQAIASFVTDDFFNDHTAALGAPSRGKAEYLDRLPKFLAEFEGLRYEPDEPICDGDRVAVPYLMRARYGGHAIALRGVFVLRFDGPLIAQRTDYWDSLSFLRQIGDAAQ